MKDINIELLNETYNRIVNVLEKNSDLIFSIGDLNNINSNLTEICLLKKNYDYYPLIFKTSLVSTKEDNKYSFLLSNKDNDCGIYIDYGMYIGCSIFKFAERCRNIYNKTNDIISKNSISYELYSSEAGKIIKDLGFPTCLEELMIKMDLMGI